MASTVICQKPSVDYFTFSTQRPKNTSYSSSTPFVWDSSPYDISPPSPESCNSIIPSPTSPTLAYPTYNLPKIEDSGKDQVFNFGSFDDWMGWDDPADNALSPTTDFFPELKLEPMSPDMGMTEPQSVNPASIQNKTERNGAFVEDPAIDEPLFQTQPQLPREELYSTPLSWAQPTSAIRRPYTRLSPQEESQLRSIAMPSTNGRTQSQSYPGSPSSTSSSPEADNRRKRKSSIDEDDDDDDDDEQRNGSGSGGRHPPVKKTAHNMIEKRYRTNLNDKIAALRDSVPSLRVMTRKNSRGEEVQEDLQGLTPAHKLNKATVLSKATEYIAHLEKRNKLLTKENTSLKSRVEAFEILMLSRQSPMPKPSSRQSNQSRQNSQRFSMDGMNGMIS